MPVSRISAVRIAGLASTLPQEFVTVANDAEMFGEETARKISNSIGVKRRHIALGNVCASDLCQIAADKLLSDLEWPRETVDAVIFVSQTPDYIIPATSCALHGRLGLSKHCATFDLNLGCSGYIYGLWIASSLINNGSLKRVLLLAGDTISRIISPQDRSTAPLFGDAGTATALEFDPAAKDMTFVLGTDGTGWNHIMVPSGGFRTPKGIETTQRTERENGNIRSDEDLFMDGTEIFAFTLREVPKLIKSTLKEAGWDNEVVDAYVFHQANTFMLKHLAKRLRLPQEKFILAMEDYGNTSSASIPLALTHALQERLTVELNNVILAGFGVGLSWGAVALTMGLMTVPKIIYLTDENPMVNQSN